METIPVTVFTPSDEAIAQSPDTFKFCPLGAQIHTRTSFAECSILELRVQLPSDDGAGMETVTCSGLVADCNPSENEGFYRVWVKFLDLPDSMRHRIKCLAQSAEFLCPYCENF